MPGEAEQQCVARDANEAVELLNVELTVGMSRAPLRCECGASACPGRLTVAHAEYEAVRGYGSRFVISLNHENPESACVLSENARFAVIDVVAGPVRHRVLADNPRHSWVDAQDRSP